MNVTQLPPRPKHPRDMSITEIAEAIGDMIDRCDLIEQDALAFLLTIAEEEARFAAGLPAIKPPSHYESDPSTGLPF